MKTIACFLLACMPLAATAQSNLVYLEFSGGGGDAITVNVLTPIQLQVESAPSNNGQYWVFDAVGDFLEGTAPAALGTLSYTWNDSAPIQIDQMNTGVSVNSVSADDLYIYNSVATDSTLISGDVLSLGTGAITTDFPVGMSPPANGFYTVFLMDGLGNEIVTSVIPEPSTFVLLLGASALALAAQRRRATSRL